MKLDLRKRLFLCFAWEDTSDVREIAADLQHELSAEIEVSQNEEKAIDLEDTVYPKIEEAEIIIVFVSEAAKNSQYVKDCVTHASNLNKRVVPVSISKSLFGISMPQEFKFRIKPLSYKSDEQRAKLFSMLKASFGVSVEVGDNYGMLIHVVTDMDATITRYGQQLCLAKTNADNTIRLTKGSHKLDFVSEEIPDLTYSLTYEVKGNDGEDFIEVPLRKRFAELKDAQEKEVREAEARKKFEEEQMRKDLEAKARNRELERQRQAAIAQSNQNVTNQTNQNSGWAHSCGMTALYMWIAFIILSVILIGSCT